QVDAIGAWYPISGLTLKEVPGSKKLFTSAEVPGLIYDALQVDRESLATRRDDWKKVVGVWFKCLEYIDDPKTKDDALNIMAKKIKTKPEELAANLKGTFLLNKEGNKKALEKRDSLDSIHGSLMNADKFFLKRGVYKDAKDIAKFVDASLVQDII